MKITLRQRINTHFFVVRQSREKGKILLRDAKNRYYRQLEKDLEEHLT